MVGYRGCVHCPTTRLSRNNGSAGDHAPETRNISYKHWGRAKRLRSRTLKRSEKCVPCGRGQGMVILGALGVAGQGYFLSGGDMPPFGVASTPCGSPTGAGSSLKVAPNLLRWFASRRIK